MEVDGEARPFLLFSKPSSRRTEPQLAPPKHPKPDPAPAVQPDNGGSGDSGSDSDADPAPTVVTERGDSCNADGAAAAADAAPASFADLGLSEWLVDVCSSLGMRCPTAVQRRCIPRALAGENVLGIAETGSGKTAAFALPILHRLGEDPFGVAALALSPTRELAAQLAEQFRALGSPLGIRCLAAIGGFDPLGQAKGLARRPHVVVATPGRIATLIKNDPDLAKVFARTKVGI
jgi:ATP-dependent RNA helicase DDX49/DBP8